MMKLGQFTNTLGLNPCYKCYRHKFSTNCLSDFPKVYNSKDAEREWYQIWQANQFFTVVNDKKEPFRMLLPPPNVTGTLHLGHALTVTLQDILARWYRMQGHEVAWIPGLDHAGIATQLIVEKHLSKTKGIKRSDMNREEFFSFVNKWKEEKGDTIRHQLKILGASLDWSKEYFTMSSDHNNAVVEAFVTLSKRNLLYRKKDLINWSPTLHSTISDIEVDRVYVTKKTQLQVPGYERPVTFGEMAYIAFPVRDSNEEITIATTRPETLFGDVAIAVHPDDERYGKFIGKQVWHILRETYVPIVADPMVNKEFGTGAVKVTPAHDPLDYTIAWNHGLDLIEAIDEHGNIAPSGKQFKGLPRFDARVKVLNELSNKGVLKEVVDHEMCIPLCSRSHDIVEYLLKEQWFVSCKEMAAKAVEAVKQNKLKIDPNNHEQTWYNHLNNIRDWCISRQIWWGHSIPAYYIEIDGKREWIVAKTKTEAKMIMNEKYGLDEGLHKDPDVLDTWFSSAILPFAIMGWPKQTESLKRYYPLSLLETGSDILFFWVARMVMLGLELTNRLPFNEVLLHGLLCDTYGKKMSKTLGNIVSPENIINGISLNDITKQLTESYNAGVLNETVLKRMMTANKKIFPNGIPQCGADALRMTLCAHNIKKKHINFDIMECQTNQFFCNKVWQAAKYILLMTGKEVFQKPASMTLIDSWILSRLSLLVNTANNAFTKRDIHEAIVSIKQFWHYEFCDFYLEGTKWGFKDESMNVRTSHTYTLRKCLETFLRLSAPVIPYLADDLYRRLGSKLPEFLSVTSLMEAPYPLPDHFNKWRDTTLDERMQETLKIIIEIRSIMSNVSKRINPEVHIVTSNPEKLNFFKNSINLLKGANRIFNTFIFEGNNYTRKDNCVCHSYNNDCTIFFVIQEPDILKQLEKKILDKSVKHKESNDRVLKHMVHE